MKEVSDEEIMEIIGDLEALGFIKVVRDKVGVTEKFVTTILNSIPLFVAFSVRNNPEVLNDYRKESAKEILSQIVLAAVLAELSIKRQEVGVKSPNKFSNDYVLRLYRVISAMIGMMKEGRHPLYQTMVSVLNVALAPYGIYKPP